MCMQRASTAAVAIGSASGIRSWLRARGGAWLTPGRMRVVTVALLGVAVLAAGLWHG